MRIVFVRHGHPNYKDDCLTDLGHLQAEAAAERLKDEPFAAMYASSCGRAYETALHIAERHGMEVEKLDFMREIRWGSIDEEPIFERGHPWYVADDMVARGEDLFTAHYEHNKVVDYAAAVASSFDEWLGGFGYRREGLYYRVERENNDTILLASHGGSSSAAMAQLLNLPLPFVCATLRLWFTSVTVITLNGEAGALVSPQIEIMNDARHIMGIGSENVYG